MRIIMFDCDTLRPDHLGCYGYTRNTSENIDRLAQDSVCFDDYYCSDAPCLPSRAALMTGLFGIHNGIIGHGGTCADMRINGAIRGMQDTLRWYSLPAMLKRRGLYTASLSSFPERHGAWWFTAGFDEWHNIGMGGMESAEMVTPKALQWLETHKEQSDWFLHVHYWDPHAPYRTPMSEGAPFADIPLPECYSWMTDEMIQQQRNEKIGPHSAWELHMFDDHTSKRLPRQLGQIRNVSDFKANVDGYDTSVWYMDKNIGQIITWLKAHNMYEDTAIILTADHGEDLGENGQYSEHGAADYPTTHIPMIIKWPDAPQNIHLSGLHYHLDLLPTLLDLLGPEKKGFIEPQNFNVPEVEYDGLSYAYNLLNGKDGGRDFLVVSQCAHVCQRAVRFDDWLYIRTYHDGYHLHEDEMLFNVTQDPFQLENLASQYKELCYKGAWLLDKWHTENMKKIAHNNPVDPLWVVISEGGPYHSRGHLGNYLERLEDTGRSWAIEPLLHRHREELTEPDLKIKYAKVCQGKGDYSD